MVDADTSFHDGQFYMCDVGSTIAGEASGHFLQFQEMGPDPLLGCLGNKGSWKRRWNRCTLLGFLGNKGF
jgi:hypothetical protein